MAKKIEWISEEAAATMLGYKPMYFRRLILEERLLGITFIRLGKGYEYSKSDIEDYKVNNANCKERRITKKIA